MEFFMEFVTVENGCLMNKHPWKGEKIMKVKDRRCLIQLDEDESELWHAFGFLLDELVAEVRNETEDEVIYQLLEEMKFRYEDVDEKSIQLFDLRG